MKVKALLIASLCAMSLSLIACGTKTEETPAVDTTATEMAPSTPAVDTAAAAATTPADTTTGAAHDTAAAAGDTTAK
jgi:hypothetical protein